MIRALTLTAALIASITTAHAGPKLLPDIFHGAWCGDAHLLQRCSDSFDQFYMNVGAARITNGKFGCSLRRLTKITHREVSATYDCEELATNLAVVRVHHKSFRIGFYPSDEAILYMHETGGER